MAQDVRNINKAAFGRALKHLGRKEFDEFEACLAEDIFQDWPYLPIPNMPGTITGRRELREFIEAGTQPFDPYSYQISEFYDMLDENALVVEYSSNTVYHPTGQPYSNKYLGILRFKDGKIVYWREYLNPLIVKESLLGDFDKAIDQR